MNEIISLNATKLGFTPFIVFPEGKTVNKWLWSELLPYPSGSSLLVNCRGIWRCSGVLKCFFFLGGALAT